MDAAPASTVSPPPGARPGGGAVARRIARQIEARLAGHGPGGDAFVVSVYGERGVGKTFCLQGVKSYFEARLDATVARLASPAAAAASTATASDATPDRAPQAAPAGATAATDVPARPEFVVPVWFDAWQYKHEEHLVVPLLKTIEHALRDLEKGGEEAVGSCRHGGR